jgi:ABC-2 type transport system ATP-binding protein
LTCKEQLLFIGNLYGLSSKYVRSRAEEILDLLGLKGQSNVLAGNLSGGMKRRLNICLALIHDPEILILDEPEAGLDPQSRIMVRDFIKAFARKKTIVLTTHNMDEADRMADRVAIIDHGKLLMLDTPQKLKNTVGEGDILELVLENSNETAINQFAGKISSLSMNVKISSGSVLIKYSNIVEHLPAIKHMAEMAGLNVSEIKLRENTLEDVFIHLTGRNMRQ